MGPVSARTPRPAGYRTGVRPGHSARPLRGIVYQRPQWYSESTGRSLRRARKRLILQDFRDIFPDVAAGRRLG
jgi:hypothetical protein